MKRKTKKLLVFGGAVAGAYLLSRHLSGKSLLGGLGDAYADALDALVNAKTPEEEAVATAAAQQAVAVGQQKAAEAAAMANAPVVSPVTPSVAAGVPVVSPQAVKPATSPLVKYGIPLALAAGLVYWFVSHRKPAAAPVL